MHPALAERPCKLCRAYLYRDGINGQFGPPVRYKGTGERVPRPRGTRPPCETCPKIPAGEEPHPDNGVEVTDQTVATYLFHLECKAVGEFPADPIVRRNAALCDSAIKAVERVRDQASGPAAVAAILGLLQR